MPLVHAIAEWEELKDEVTEVAQDIADLTDSVQECGNRLEDLASELEELLGELDEKIGECEETAESFRSVVEAFIDWTADELPEKVENTANQIASDASGLDDMFASRLSQEIGERFEELADEGQERLNNVQEAVVTLAGKFEDDIEQRRTKVEDWYEQTKDETMGRFQNLEGAFVTVSEEFERTGRNISHIMEMKDFAVAETNVAMTTCADVADLVRSTVEQVV